MNITAPYFSFTTADTLLDCKSNFEKTSIKGNFFSKFQREYSKFHPNDM